MIAIIPLSEINISLHLLICKYAKILFILLLWGKDILGGNKIK
jgi:hypothetical protein